MIKVNRKSWHFWLFNIIDNFGEPKNLCNYMRKVLGGGFLVVWAGYIALIFAVITLYYYIVVITTLLNGANYFNFGLFLLSGSVNTLLLYFLVTEVIFPKAKSIYILDRLSPTIEVYTPSFISLLWKYVKAGKQKICPLVEGIDK